jgi:hypothetical protein
MPEKPAAELVGRWRITAMNGFDRDDIDLIEPAHIEFTEDGTGRFGFVAVLGWLDCRPARRDGRIGVEFSWEGDDDGDRASGRGWAFAVDGGTIEGHVFLHLGDDSSFRAERRTAGD